MRTKKLFYLLVFLFLALSISVHAEDFISAIFEPFAGIDIARTYNNPAVTPFIDFVLVFIFFLGLSRVSIGNLEQFKGRGGTLTISMFSIILSIGFVVWEQMSGFNLGDLAPLAAMFFALALGFFIFKIFRGFGANGAGAGAFGYVMLYSMIIMVMPQLVDTIRGNSLVWGFFNMIFPDREYIW